MPTKTYTYRLIHKSEMDFIKAAAEAEAAGFEMHACGCDHADAKYDPKWWAIMRKPNKTSSKMSYTRVT